MKYAGKICAFTESACEEGKDENTKETLYNFLETELGIEDARRIEFQRVHRVGKEKRNPREPRAGS